MEGNWKLRGGWGRGVRGGGREEGKGRGGGEGEGRKSKSQGARSVVRGTRSGLGGRVEALRQASLTNIDVQG